MLESWELSLRKLWAEVNKNVISDLVLVCGAASCSKQSSPPSTHIRNIGKIKKEWEGSREARARHATHTPLPLTGPSLGPLGYTASIYYPSSARSPVAMQPAPTCPCKEPSLDASRENTHVDFRFSFVLGLLL